VNLDREEGVGFFNAFLKKVDLIIYFSFHSFILLFSPPSRILTMKVAMGERKKTFIIKGNPKLVLKALLTFNSEK
jgi:hypothetical protein